LIKHDIQVKGTDFASLSWFVDSVHLSPYGTELLADALLARSIP
jgi:hypothetical protein